MSRMCSMCRQVKPESEFRFDKKRGYYDSYCRDCSRAYNTHYMRCYREKKKQDLERCRNEID